MALTQNPPEGIIPQIVWCIEWITQLRNRLGSGGSGGSVTSIAVNSPLTGGIITNIGSISIPKADSSTDGYLSAVDFNLFSSGVTALPMQVAQTINITIPIIAPIVGVFTAGDSITGATT